MNNDFDNENLITSFNSPDLKIKYTVHVIRQGVCNQKMSVYTGC